ncbi:ionotropic glutamate receptor [Holotrichia oblita]|uniref:Ionotropic glutamate receptor n=1 Tax=Holotrichia oblita TaxID=644536 RepID=A0ACB9T4Y0_HOLOL|nr:ionotropic glutamate receptor [Holotrichia oblita]
MAQSSKNGIGDKFTSRQLPPLRGAKMYFAIAAMASEQSYSRAFNKALMNITQSYLEGKFKETRYNITLDTLAIELPENGSFTATLLEGLCSKFEGKHVVAVLVIGNTPAAQTVTLAATHSGIPVLWAKGQGGMVPGFRSLELNPLEIHLAPTSREMAQALRGLLLQAHWHTFTIIADSESTSALQRYELRGTLSESPLHPTLIPLPSPPLAQIIFRKLADVSRSTRGVVILMTDHNMAGRILEYARRLNMLDGHFVWLWINTAGSLKDKNYTDTSETNQDRIEKRSAKFETPKREDSTHHRDIDHFRNDINDMQFNSILKNDHFLFFNTNNRYRYNSNSRSKSDSETIYSRSRSRRDIFFETANINVNPADKFGGDRAILPQGLLSLRALPVRVDRHLVKGAVRLLVAALERALLNIPIWLVDNLQRTQMSTSCWRPSGDSERNFSLFLAR